MRTYKQCYQHSETGSLYAIEHSWDGHIVSSAGPLEEPLQKPDNYNYTTELNTWLETQSDKLILI
jgi:hypothetical protein